MDAVEYRNSRPQEDSPLPVATYHATTAPEEYDLNFRYPVQVLESSGVRLEPLIPSLHAPYLYSRLSHSACDNYRFFGATAPRTYDDYLTHLEGVFRNNPAACNFVIHDKSRLDEDGKACIAGSIGYMEANPSRRTVELAWVCVLPEFHRTHVTTHAAGLLIRNALDDSPRGLGLRRIEWFAHDKNVASQRAALRLGFKHEGTIRHYDRLDPGKEGSSTVEGDDHPARHLWLSSITVDDWKQGVRERVDELMAREVKMS